MNAYKNSVVYKYEYSYNSLMTKLRKIIDTNESVTNFYYDYLGTLTSLTEDISNTTINILYDSSGNRRRFIKIKDNKEIVKEYTIDNMNQYQTDGTSLYTYDNSGNIVEEYNKITSDQKQYSYYDDGKLSTFLSKDDNCSLKYDCLERLSQLNCSKGGLFVFYYDLVLELPLSLSLPNGTFINFIYIPGTSKAIGYVIDNTIYYFEYDGRVFSWSNS